MPLIVGTDADLPPPLIGTDVPGSAPGIPQPVIVTGGESLPPSFPLGTAGTWMPPPLVGEGGNVPFPTPVVPPGSGLPGVTQPQFVTGSPTAPASYFPDYSSPGPFQPIVLTNLMQIGPGPPPFTAGSQPITVSTVPTIPQLPWNPNPDLPELPPVNTVRPTVTPIGTINVNELLAASTGTWTTTEPPLTYAREWWRNGSPIAGATGLSYTLTAADLGTLIACNVTAKDANGVEASMDSLEIGPVLPALAIPTSGQSFNATLPLVADQSIGTVLVTSTAPTPSAFAITSGNASGYWQINAAGQLSATTAGAAGVIAGSTTLGVTATNTGGTSAPVNVSIVVAAAADEEGTLPARRVAHTPAKRAKRR